MAAAQEIAPGVGGINESGTTSCPIVPAGLFALGAGLVDLSSGGAGGYPAWIHGATTFPT